jgi:hypothetical protein
MVDLVMTHDYKVIQSVDRVPGPEDNEFWYSDRPCLETFWIIYSLNSNSWRKLDLNLPNHYCFTPNRLVGVYTNGVCHWWARTCDSPNIEDAEECLLSFNFSNELMFTTPRPSYVDVKLRRSFKSALGRCLMLLNESVALISTDLEMDTVHISILGELGVRESWTKLLIVEHLPLIGRPIGVGNQSNILFFQKTDGKLACVDLSTKMIEEDLGVKGWLFGCNIGKYKK